MVSYYILSHKTVYGLNKMMLLRIVPDWFENLNQTFENKWIGNSCDIACPAHMHDLTPPDHFLRDFIK